MNLKEQIEKDFIEAYKAKDETKVSVLRMIKSSLKNEEIKKKTLTEEDVLQVLNREAKQRKESIAQFNDLGQREAAEKESSELAIIETYLPELLNEDETKKIVEEAIAETGASNIGQLGQVIGKVMSTNKGKVDGALVSKIAKESLQK